MKKKILMSGIGVLILGVTISLSSAYADGFKQGGHRGEGGEKLAGMFFMKAHFILKNQEALGLAEDKVEAIKQLKLETAKEMVRQNAEVEIVSLDVMSKLHDYPVDVKALNTLLDRKYELKKAGAKNRVAAIAQLKATLTPDQYAKLRGLWQSADKGKCHE